MTNGKQVLQKLVGAKLGRDKLPKVELNGAAESALVKMLRSGSMTFSKSELGGSHIKQGLMLMGSSFPTTKKKVAKYSIPREISGKNIPYH